MKTFSFRSMKWENTVTLSLVFILFTVVGTLSHEWGHIAIAQLLGYPTELHFASMNYGNNVESIPLVDDILILSGGPLQTFLTALIGLVILKRRESSIKELGMQGIDWLALFLALFLLRAIFNYTYGIVSGLLLAGDPFFRGDEAILSQIVLGQSPFVLPTINAVISAMGVAWVIFYVLPKVHRAKLILGGLIGGVLGYLLWMKALGPYLLP